MKKCFLIASSNLRRAKGLASAIAVLTILASLMLHLWLMLSTDYKANFDVYHDKLNAEHVTLAIGARGSELQHFVSQTLEQDNRTADFFWDDILFGKGSFGYNGGQVSLSLLFLNKEAALNRSIGKAEIIEDSEYTSGIYLPMLYRTDPDISVGKTIDITFGNTVVSYPICGFFNSVMAGSNNCGIMELLLTDDRYEELTEKDCCLESSLVSVRIYDKSESDAFEAMLKNAVSSRYPGVITESNSYTLVSRSRYISQMICSGVISAMAFMVILITLVVIVSNVNNYIRQNMKNLGALKAMGYQSRQIIASLLLQFLSITLISAAIGIGLSYCLFPSVNAMMVSQTGIPYTMRFLPLPFVSAFVSVGGTVALSVWLSARRIKKIEPITALRQGVSTHSFKRNHVPLSQTRLPLNVALAVKTTCMSIKQNMIVCVTMLVFSLLIVFSCLMIRNIILDTQPFIHMVVGETADSCINVDTAAEQEFLQTMRADDRVQKIYLYHRAEVHHAGDIGLYTYISDDFTKFNNQNYCIEGRFPIYENEVAVGAKYAEEANLEIGEEITLAAGGKKAGYIICGYTQISNWFGKDCLLTRNGYERMDVLQNASYYLDLADDVDIDSFNKQANKQFENEINASDNILSTVNGFSAVYISLITIIVIVILLLSAFIIAFVLHLLVKTTLNNKKSDYGIMKALGYTTAQLMLQTTLSFMPAVLISSLAGFTVSAFIINPLTALFISGIGIVKCVFVVPVGFIIVSGVALILFTFAVTCLLSLRIRKIAPRSLLVGE